MYNTKAMMAEDSMRRGDTLWPALDVVVIVVVLLALPWRDGEEEDEEEETAGGAWALARGIPLLL